jgi:hypothetical protein
MKKLMASPEGKRDFLWPACKANMLTHPEVGRPAIRVTAAASGQIRGNYTFILVSLSALMPLYEPSSQSKKLSTTAKLQSA